MKRVQIEISNEATYFSYVCMLSDYERIRANWKNGMETAETKTSANKTIKTFLPFLLEATYFLCVFVLMFTAIHHSPLRRRQPLAEK